LEQRRWLGDGIVLFHVSTNMETWCSLSRFISMSVEIPGASLLVFRPDDGTNARQVRRKTAR
jgi:hypothetical protein